MKKIDIKTFKKITFEEHDLYHVTNSEIENVDESVLEKETGNHPNSALGLWCSTVPKRYASFGKNCYKIILKKDRKINYKGWDYGEFFNYCCGRCESQDEEERIGIKTRKNYIELRDYLIKNNIDMIYIFDGNGSINEVIILNYECIESLIKSSDAPNRNFWLHCV